MTSRLTIRDKKGRKKCNDCLEWKPEKEFYKNRHKMDGLSEVCKKCKDKFHHRPRGLFSRYKVEAKHDKREFLLSFDEFNSIIMQPCFYCGENEKRRGIDRINNKIGYVLSNCASCCTFCNYMKHNKTQERFKEQIIKIFYNWARFE